MAEDMHPQVVQADGIAGLDMGLTVVGNILGIHDGDGAFSEDLDGAVVFEHGTGIFVDADADAIGMEGAP